MSPGPSYGDSVTVLLRRVGGVVGTLAALAAVAVALAVAVVPALGGATVYTVLSPSMVPTLPPGTAVVVRPRPVGSIVVGDVVTFTARDPASTATRVVTHRVVAVQPGPALVTRGDANPDPDPGTVAPADVRGVLWYSVPWVGRAAEALRSSSGLLVGGGAVLLLVGLALLVPRRARA